MAERESLFDDVLDSLEPETQERVRAIIRRLETRIILLTGERDALLQEATKV